MMPNQPTTPNPAIASQLDSGQHRRGKLSPFLAWLSNNLAVAISIAGGFLYVLALGGYRIALRPFGLIPSELGIDYPTTVWNLVPFLFMMGGALSIFALTTHNSILSLSLRSRFLIAYTVIAGALALAIMFQQTEYVRVVRRGDRYDPLLSYVSPLSLRAQLINVAWKEPGANKTPLPSGKVLLLGISDGTVVLYAADSSSIWRLPASDVVLVAKMPTPAPAPTRPVARPGP